MGLPTRLSRGSPPCHQRNEQAQLTLPVLRSPVLSGTLMKITNNSRELIWVAILDEKIQRFWVYSAQTRKFHLHKPLIPDFVLFQELTYTRIGQEEAQRFVGRSRPRLGNFALAKRCTEDTDVVPAEKVFEQQGRDGCTLPLLGHIAASSGTLRWAWDSREHEECHSCRRCHHRPGPWPEATRA